MTCSEAAQCLLQDYARLHSYKIVATSAVADPTLDNMWNKVGWLLKAYHVRPAPSVLQHPAFCGRDSSQIQAKWQNCENGPFF